MPLSQVRPNRPGRRVVRPMYRPPGPAMAPTVMPYDYGAKFQLTGEPGTILEDVVNVGADGTFVAVGIGYGLEPRRDCRLVADPSGSTGPGSLIALENFKLPEVGLGAAVFGFGLNRSALDVHFRKDVLAHRNGKQTIKLTPRAKLAVSGSTVPGSMTFMAATPGGAPGTNLNPAPTTPRNETLVCQEPAAPLSFLFSIMDSSTGREFQDQPVLGSASMGEAEGRRPFRMFASPITLHPRSTIRMQVIERSANVRGTLFVVLYGYRVLTPGCSESVIRSMPGGYPSGGLSAQEPSSRVIPFDYVSTFDLTGFEGNTLIDEVPINADGAFVATSIGYGVTCEDQIRLASAEEVKNGTPIDLTNLSLDMFPPEALACGIRIRPEMIRLVIDANGAFRTDVPPDLANRMFEPLLGPKDVSFRYAITDTGTGRDMQNQPLNNVAGLGIATGERPFKKLAREMLFRPNSTIRVMVREHIGCGRLYIVFHGYKILGSSMFAGGR